MDHQFKKKRFQYILDSAIQSKHRQTILTLAVVARKHEVCDSNLTHGQDLSCVELWIKTAIQTGCMETFQTTMTLIGSMKHIVPISAKRLVAKVLLFSCEHGQGEIL